MPNRRDFVKTVAGAAASVSSSLATASPRELRRTASRDDRRPSRDRRRRARAYVRARGVGSGEGHASGGVGQEQPHRRDRPRSGTAARLRAWTRRASTIRPSTSTPGATRRTARSLATSIQLQNEKIAAAVAAHPDRFVGMATLALQHPDLAADQLDVRREQAGTTGRRHRGQRGRAGAVGPEVRSVLGQGGAARRAAVHASSERARDDIEHAV